MSDITTIPAGKNPLVLQRERLDARKGELKTMLPADISPDNFIRAYTSLATINPDLQAVTWQSLWESLIKAARAGLLPDGVESAIVAFGSKAQWIPMVQGVLRSARRSGQLKWIDGNVVRAGEDFEYSITQDGPRFRHVPGENFDAPILRAYAVATTKDGGFFCNVMSKAEIDKHRAYSRTTRDDAPWKKWPEAMSIKTAIKGLGKYLPSVRDAVAEDDSLPNDAELPARPAPATNVVTGEPSRPVNFETGASVLSAGILPESADASPEGGAPEVDAQGPSTSAAVESRSLIVLAYNDGMDARANNEPRKAIPKHYREADRVQEQIAWLAGWDGKEIPTFEEQ